MMEKTISIKTNNLGGSILTMTLKGELGDLSFSFRTGWKSRKSYELHLHTDAETNEVLKFCKRLEPRLYTLFYTSNSNPAKFIITDYNLQEEILETLIEKGSDKVWIKLEEVYEKYLKTENKAVI